jgi:hypothetical protein
MVTNYIFYIKNIIHPLIIDNSVYLITYSSRNIKLRMKNTNHTINLGTQGKNKAFNHYGLKPNKYSKAKIFTQYRSNKSQPNNLFNL